MNWSKANKAVDDSAPSPDIATYSPNFYSVHEELRHYPNRYSPLGTNGWKLALDLDREFLHLFGKYPRNPTYDLISSILRGYYESQRRATKPNFIDPIIEEHASNTRRTCTCMLCHEHVRSITDVNHYLEFKKTLTPTTNLKTQPTKPWPPLTSSDGPDHYNSCIRRIRRAVSKDLTSLCHIWKADTDQAAHPGPTLPYLMGNYLQRFGVHPKTPPPRRQKTRIPLTPS